jgi:hypothetical protein
MIRAHRSVFRAFPSIIPYFHNAISADIQPSKEYSCSNRLQLKMTGFSCLSQRQYHQQFLLTVIRRLSTGIEMVQFCRIRIKRLLENCWHSEMYCEVFVGLLVESQPFRDMTPYWSVNIHRRFGVDCCLKFSTYTSNEYINIYQLNLNIHFWKIKSKSSVMS